MQILISEKRTKMEFIKEKIYDDYQLDLASIDWKAEYWESQNDLTIELSTEGLEDFSKNNFKIENRKEMPSEKDLMEMESLDWIKI